MAYYGLSKPIIAKLNPETGAYSSGMVLAQLVGTNVTPQFAEGSLFCDNKLGYHKKMFKEADVSVETDYVPLSACEILFGHTLDTTKKQETSKSTDTPSYVGYGFIGEEETSEGMKEFTACWMTKVQFSEGADDLKTRGDTITFGTHKLSGKAFADKNNVWREKQVFDTEDAALEYLKTKAGITDAA